MDLDYWVAVYCCIHARCLMGAAALPFPVQRCVVCADRSVRLGPIRCGSNRQLPSCYLQRVFRWRGGGSGDRQLFQHTTTMVCTKGTSISNIIGPVLELCLVGVVGVACANEGEKKWPDGQLSAVASHFGERRTVVVYSDFPATDNNNPTGHFQYDDR